MDLLQLINIPIDYALWEVTSRCNLSCIHCRANASPQVKDDFLIEGEHAKQILDSLVNLGTGTIVFTGGEPLIRSDLEDLILYATSIGIRCRVQSNGLLLTESRIKRLRDAGIISFGVGLDSPFPETHDYIRNRSGAYRKAIKAIRLVKKFGISCHVESTLIRMNIDHLSDMFKLLDSLDVDTFLIRSAIFSGRTSVEKQEFLLKPNEYRDALTELYELSEYYPSIKANSQDPLYNVVNPSVEKYLSQWGNIESGQVLCGCTVGVNMIHIKSNGNVGVCTFLPAIRLGNCITESLEEIWKNRFNNSDLLRKIVQRELKGKCNNCNYRYICGGCRARAFGVHNDMLEEDPYCWKLFSIAIKG